MDSPTWHTSQSNIDRTNAVLKTIADKYKDLTGVVPAIAPLNEYVPETRINTHISLTFTSRPAGFVSQDLLDVTKQYWKDSYNSIR
jgi:glucan 1,3-beta-glucosidase